MRLFPTEIIKRCALSCACAVFMSVPIAAGAVPIGANYGAGWSLQSRNAFFSAEQAIGPLLPTRYTGETIVIDTYWDPFVNDDGTPDTNTLGGYLKLPSQWTENFGSTLPVYQSDTLYPASLANHLHGSDLFPGSEATIEFNSNFPMADWYFGLDGNSGNKIDFMTVAMHEIIHALGFGKTVVANGSFMFGGHPSDPSIYERFVQGDNGHGEIEPIVRMDDQERSTAITSGDLSWFGAAGVAANSGNPVALYAPDPFEPGSSVTHLDPVAFPSNLMDPFIGTAVHTVSGIEKGMLRDVGWVPEPGTLYLVGLGLGLLILVTRTQARSA